MELSKTHLSNKWWRLGLVVRRSVPHLSTTCFLQWSRHGLQIRPENANTQKTILAAIYEASCWGHSCHRPWETVEKLDTHLSAKHGGCDVRQPLCAHPSYPSSARHVIMHRFVERRLRLVIIIYLGIYLNKVAANCQRHY